MPSGNKQMVINPRERAVSTDINRLQAFGGADFAEVLRYLLGVALNDDVEANGVALEVTTTTSPLAGMVLDGLMPSPVALSANMLVTPGVLCCIDPDAVPNPDDSVMKVVVDPGVQLAGALVLAANASGATRIDVVECSRIDVVLETDNRDQFNTSTGLFSPVTFNKVTASRLAYRVRAGVGGGGFPGTALGWLPLAVALVPNGSVTWDTVTLYDVRPLSADLINAPFASSKVLPDMGKQLMRAERAGGSINLTGIVETMLAGWRAGGTLGLGEVLVVDLLSAQVIESGFAPIANLPYYVYLVQPFGLPRWARYAGSGTRVPRTPRGIIVTSVVPPASMVGTPLVPIALPAILGLGGSSSNAVCIAAGVTNNAGVARGFDVDGHITTFTDTGADALVSAVFNSDAARFDLIDAITHPPNARAVWMRFALPGINLNGQPAGSMPLDRLVATFDLTNTTPRPEQCAGRTLQTDTAVSGDFFDVRVPLLDTYPNDLGGHTRRLRYTYNAAANSVGGPSSLLGAPVALVLGWEIGP